MPERSEWLVAEGVAKRNLGIVTPTIMRLKDAKIGFFGDNIRVLQTLFMGMMVFRGLR